MVVRLGQLHHVPFLQVARHDFHFRVAKASATTFGGAPYRVLLGVATACLIYRAVALFRPVRALAAAISFLLMPGFAFSAAWVAAGFDIQFTFWGVAYILCVVKYWRGGHPLYPWIPVAFVIALGCKETALSIPICAAQVLFIAAIEAIGAELRSLLPLRAGLSSYTWRSARLGFSE